jgi:hypothetical protein
MKRRHIALSVACLFLIQMNDVSFAAVKAGGICTKLNATSTSGGYKFTCIKSGKKLVWNKGVKITTATPTQSAKPLSNLPGKGRAGRFEYRYPEGVIQRKNIDGIWRIDDSRTNSDFDAIRVAAYESIRGVTNSSQELKIQVREHIADNFPKELAAIIRLQIAEVNQRISKYLPKLMPLDLVLVTEKDTSFVENVVPTLISKNYYGNNLDILTSYLDPQGFYSRSGTGGGTAGYQSEKESAYYLGNTASYADVTTFWPEVAPHETAHAIQFFLSGGWVNSEPEGSANAKYTGHLIEGSANLIGMAIAFPNIGWYSDEMDKILKDDISSYKTWNPMRNVDDAVTLLQNIESRQTDQTAAFCYSAGQILWEYYVGTYGFSKLLELFQNISKTSSFNENLEYTIGIDKKTFYQDAAPYMLRTWNRLNN